MSVETPGELLKEQRAQIVGYLRAMGRAEIGTILSPESRKVVEWCASWIENERDEVWAAEVAGRDGG